MRGLALDDRQPSMAVPEDQKHASRLSIASPRSRIPAPESHVSVSPNVQIYWIEQEYHGLNRVKMQKGTSNTVKTSIITVLITAVFTSVIMPAAGERLPVGI
jgi:ABC-type lipoprotein release transport system permease subunit